MQSRFNYLVLTALYVIAVQNVCMNRAKAADWFNPSLLGDSSGKIVTGSSSGMSDDMLQRLANGQQPPGIYTLDIYVNNHSVGKRDVILTSDSPDKSLTPTLSAKDVLSFGVKPEVLFVNGKFSISDDVDTPVKGILNQVPGTQVFFDFSRQRLNISIPEILMTKDLSGATDPRFWDEGIAALVTDYNFSAWRSKTSDISDTDTAFLSLDNSFRAWGWRLNNFSTWNRSESNGDDDQSTLLTQEWNSVNTWVSRPVPRFRGIFNAGDYYTTSDVFDSFQFQGLQLASDEEMNPDYLNNFAPVVRGTASGNAQVTIRQNGNIVYQTTVAAGPFSITDIPAASLSGDFLVTIREADGTERSFIQGNSSVAVMQREGQLRYAFAAGKLRDSSVGTSEPSFMQGTLIYGLPYDLTAFGGTIVSHDYLAFNTGLGVLMGVAGALSLDGTLTKTDRENITDEDIAESDVGHSWRVRYSKSFVETGSTLAVSANHYTTGYWNFSDANSSGREHEYRNTPTENGVISQPVTDDRVRHEFQVSLSQNLGDGLGSLGAEVSLKNYQNIDGEDKSVSINWNTTVSDIGLGIGYQISKWAENAQNNERLVSLMVTLPLQQWLNTSHALYSSNNYAQNDSGKQTFSNTIGGSLLSENNLTWNAGQSSIRAGNDAGEDSDNATMSLNYSGGQGRISGGYSYSADSKQYDLGLQGGVMLTRYGVTLSQTPGETMALVRAPGADDVRVRNGTGVTTDRFGNAVVPVQPYKRNKIDLDLLTVGENVTLDDTSRVVIPIRGAVVVAYYDTAIGYQILMNLTHKGNPLPFGSMVSLEKNKNMEDENDRATGGSGIVGDRGQVWMAGMPEEGVLKVIWGEGDDRRCRIFYKLSEEEIRVAKDNHLPVTTKGECS